MLCHCHQTRREEMRGGKEAAGLALWDERSSALRFRDVSGFCP